MAEKAKKEKNIKKEKNSSKKIKKSSKKNTPKEGYIKQVNKELKLVKWPSFKEVAKYTISTIVFCLIVCVFFILLNLLLSFVKGLFV